MDDGHYGAVAGIKGTNRGLFGNRALSSPVRLSARNMTANDVVSHSGADPALTAHFATTCGSKVKGTDVTLALKPYGWLSKPSGATQAEIDCLSPK